MTDKQLFFIHHVDVTDKELDDLFENVRRFVEWFNPEEYFKKRSQRTFTKRHERRRLRKDDR